MKQSKRMQYVARFIFSILFLVFVTSVSAQINDFTIEPAGHLGGDVKCGKVQGDYAYLGQGTFLTIMDITANPPQQVAGLDMGEMMFDLVISDNTCYILLTNIDSLTVVDISDPLAPTQIGSLALPEYQNNAGLDISGDRLYAGTSGGLHIVDISVPSSPVVLGSNQDNISDVFVMGGVAFCTAGSRFKTYDVSGTAPVEFGSVSVSGARTVTANGNYAFVGAGFLDNKVYIFDITNPQSPQEVSVFETRTTTAEPSPTSILVEDSTAYVGCTNWLFTFDITDPADAVELSAWESDGWVVNIQKTGDDLHIIQRASDFPYRKLIMSDPSNPAVDLNFESPSDVLYILANSDRLYVASWERFWIYDITVQDQPALMSSFPQWAGLRRLAVQDDDLYALIDTDLQLFDASDPYNVSRISSYPLASGTPAEMAVQDSFVYLLVKDTLPRLEIVNISTPTTPVTMGQIGLSGTVADLFIQDTVAFVVYNNGDADRGIQLVDVSNPENPANMGNFQTTGEPTCVWVSDSVAFVGSNISAGVSDHTYYLQSVNISDPTTSTALYEATGEGLIQDVEFQGGVVFAGVQYGSIHTFVWQFDGFKLYRVCPSSSTADITVTSPKMTSSTTSSGTAYSTEGDTYDGEISGVGGIVFQNYFIVREGQGGLATSVAPTQKAGTASPPNATGPIGTQVQVKAEENLGWAFTHWTNATPANSKTATAVLADPPTQVVAHFMPILTLSPGALNPGYTTACPAIDENDDTNTPIIQIQLTASPADDWELSSVGFEIVGNLESKHVRNVNLRLGSDLGPMLASIEYSSHFSFSVPSPYNKISAGSGVTFMITMDFEDKEALGEGDPIQFTVFTNRTFIGATAETYPPGEILPNVPPPQTVLGGPIFLGCVHNMTTKQVALKIQDGIDEETTQDGHTLLVCPGNYTENVEVNKSLTIQSMQGADVTTIAADIKDKPSITIMKPDVTLDGFTVKDAGNSEQPIGGAGVFIKDNQTTLKNMKITQNWDGIHAAGSGKRTIHIMDTEITSNTSNGIVYYPQSAAGDSLTLTQVKINNNGNYGFWAGVDTRISGNSVEIAGNGADGIRFDGKLNLKTTGAVIRKNTGWGIEGMELNAEKGILLIRQGLNVRENTQGGIKGTFLDIGSSTIIEQNSGNGIESSNAVTASTIQIKDNSGWGIEAKDNVTLTGDGSLISGNQDGGVFSENGKVLLSGSNTVIAENQGNGIQSGDGEIELSGNTAVVRGNQGDGILSVNGNIRIASSNSEIKNNEGWGVSSWDKQKTSPGQGSIFFNQKATIRDNKKGGVLTYRFVKIAAKVNIYANQGDGINAREGLETDDELLVTNNQGTGIQSGTVTFHNPGNMITDNQQSGIQCELLIMEGKDNWITGNKGWAVWATEIRLSHPVKIDLNTEGGIHTLKQLILPDNFTVDNNLGVGIEVQSGLTATNLKVEYNEGDGIKSYGKTVLSGNKTSISYNEGNGLNMESLFPADLVMQGGQVNHNGKYGAVVMDNASRSFDLVSFKGNTLGAILYVRSEDGTSAAKYENSIQGEHLPITSPQRIMANTDRNGIHKCMISENGGDGILFEGNLDLTITQTSFVNNSGFGINNLSSSTCIMAQGNWWGDIAGPSGGDGVSGNVDFTSWLAAPIALTVSAVWDTVYTPAGRTDSVLCLFQNWEAFDDIIDVIFTDELGWTTIPPFTLTFQDSAGADTLIHYTVTTNTPVGTENRFRINAASQTDGFWTASDSFLVVIYESNLVRLAVSPDSTSLQPGQSIQFKVKGLDEHENPVPVSVTWSATGGIIDSTGLFTAGNVEGLFLVTVMDKASQISGTAKVVISLTTDIAAGNLQKIPTSFSLSQNYPNPFNPETEIEFSVKERCQVILKIYDIRGREIATLVDAVHAPGFYQVTFDARQLPSGLYFYSIKMKNFHAVKKMVLVE